MWHKPEHMHAGIAAAHASPNTPAHLKPHLEQRMKKVKGKPITGAKTQMTFGQGKQGPGGPALQSQIKASPAPFANPNGMLKPVAGSKPGGKPTTHGGKSNHGFYGGK